MKKAFVSTWHNFEEPFNTQYHKVYWDFFVINLSKWQDIVDKIYIIYDNWNFTEAEMSQFTPKVVFYKSPILGHGNAQIAHFLPSIEEDQILIMDNDCFIYDRRGVEDWFNKLDGHDAVVTFNNIGGLQDGIWNKYPFMKEHQYQTFYSNHYAISKEFVKLLETKDYYETTFYKPGTYIPELDYTTKEGDWEEGKMTMVCKLLDRNNFAEMPIIPNQGFHHLHSVSWAYLLLAHKGDATYWDFINGQPIEKILKILSWFITVDYYGQYTSEIKEVIKDVLTHKIHYFQ